MSQVSVIYCRVWNVDKCANASNMYIAKWENVDKILILILQGIKDHHPMHWWNSKKIWK